MKQKQKLKDAQANQMKKDHSLAHQSDHMIRSCIFLPQALMAKQATRIVLSPSVLATILCWLSHYSSFVCCDSVPNRPFHLI